MNNLYQNRNLFSSEEIIKYVKIIVNHKPVIQEFNIAQGWYKDEHIQQQFFMVLNHFHFVIIDDDFEDKIYRFSFLIRDNNLLQYYEDEIYYRQIEKICSDSKKIIRPDEKSFTSPAELEPSIWMPKDKDIIQHRINNIINSKILLPVRQK